MAGAGASDMRGGLSGRRRGIKFLFFKKKKSLT